MSWYVEVGFSTGEPVGDDAAFAIMDKLGGLPMGRSADLMEGEIGVTVDAETAAAAVELGVSRIREAVADITGKFDLTRIEVMTTDRLEFENAKPLFPEVVGYAEIAKMADVTRQTAREYANSKSFPGAVIRTAQGPLHAKASVEAWLKARREKAGVPRNGGLVTS